MAASVRTKPSSGSRRRDRESETGAKIDTVTERRLSAGLSSRLRRIVNLISSLTSRIGGESERCCTSLGQILVADSHDPVDDELTVEWAKMRRWLHRSTLVNSRHSAWSQRRSASTARASSGTIGADPEERVGPDYE